MPLEEVIVVSISPMGVQEKRNNLMLTVIAVALLVIAGLLFWHHSLRGREKFRQPQPVEKSFEEQAQAIIDNPKVPMQAKEEVVGKIRQQFHNAPLQAPPQTSR